MAKTKLNTKGVQDGLRTLGYYDGPSDGDYLDPNYRADLRRFQWWAKRIAKTYKGAIDGWYGPGTEGALLPVLKLIKKHAPCQFKAFRRFQQTYYYIGRARGGSIPMVTPKGKLLATMSPGSFVEAALEGTTVLRDGRIANVAGNPKYRRVDAATFKPVYDIAKRNGWIKRGIPGYAGITLTGDKKNAKSARTFYIKKAGPGGFPTERLGIEMDPWRTIATDTGRLRRHAKTWKGKGGLIPSGTKCWILEYVGVKLPDGTLHDGWVTANDTGGGIFGVHFDMFVGYRAWRNKVKATSMSRVHLWFDGIEDKIDANYSYGLS
jgi:3D (Asp-Asp-Asp) domain-containing protein